MKLIALAAAALVALSVAACGDTILNVPTSPSPNASATPNVPVLGRHTIAFRVQGNPSAARVRFSTPIDGLVQVTTTLPYNATFQTNSDNMFLSLEGTPLSYPIAINNPFFSIQIIVDGYLFREATSAEFLLNTLSINGTWRQ
jgi:hypothetical protein